MGCHTWFYRPITQEEFNWLKEWAVEGAKRYFGDTEENRKYCPSAIDPWTIKMIEKSVETDEACYYGMTWYEAGFGCGNPKFIERDGCTPFIYYIKNKKAKEAYENLYFCVDFKPEYLEKVYHMTDMNEFIESGIPSKVDFPYFGDDFRIGNYPTKVIHSRKELRRYLRKRYFKLTDYQLQRVSMFFKIYPGGIITFG